MSDLGTMDFANTEFELRLSNGKVVIRKGEDDRFYFFVCRQDGGDWKNVGAYGHFDKNSTIEDFSDFLRGVGRSCPDRSIDKMKLEESVNEAYALRQLVSLKNEQIQELHERISNTPWKVAKRKAKHLWNSVLQSLTIE